MEPIYFKTACKVIAEGKIVFFRKPKPGINKSVDDSDLFYSPQSHFHLESIMLLDGSASILINSEWKQLSESEFWVFTPGTVHSERRTEIDLEYQLFWISIHSNTVTFHTTSYLPGQGYSASGKRISVQTPFNRQLWETATDQKLPNLKLEQQHFQALLIEMLYYVIKNFSRIEQTAGQYHQRIIDQVKLYIEKYYTQDISLSQIAGMVHYSPGHLNVLFRKQVGMPIHQYLIKCRLAHAAQALHDEDIFINDLAASLGFQDPLYFSRLFRKHYGLSPRKYAEKGK